MYNKKVYPILVILFMITVCSNLFSQGFMDNKDKNPTERLETMMKDLTRRLSLSETQAEKIREIFIEHNKNNRPQIMGRNRNESPSRNESLPNWEELDKKVLDLLSTEQAIKYKEWRNDMLNRQNRELPMGLRK